MGEDSTSWTVSLSLFPPPCSLGASVPSLSGLDPRFDVSEWMMAFPRAHQTRRERWLPGAQRFPEQVQATSPLAQRPLAPRQQVQQSLLAIQAEER